MDARSPRVVDRQASIDWFLNTRARTAKMFDLLTGQAYYEQPIPLRHPVVFYEGHIPAFSVNTLIKRGLGRDGLDEDLERLFERGIDPEDQDSADSMANLSWPTRETVLRYTAAADETILEALGHRNIERDHPPMLHRGQAVFTLIEHEELHQETLAYMWHQLPASRKRRPANTSVITDGVVPEYRQVRVPSGSATLGAMPDEIPFGWDNEFPRLRVKVPAFTIDAHNVTNQQYLEFIKAGGYTDQAYWCDTGWAWRVGSSVEHPAFWCHRAGEWFWRGMFELIPLPPAWPVYVTHAEASAFARWKGLRLPTEAEFHRAAFGAPGGVERILPWGAAPADATRGNFGFQRWDPVPVGSYPAGASAWGVHDLVGNGWEWTSTVFDGFPGFQPMASYPQYSADFFDGRHYVIKGASSATAYGLVRRSLRNWFRPCYPYVYAGFRCVGDRQFGNH